jgi:phenylpyruvate tautomerase PptA (4-oxalocrotonate tautomerase family)
MPVVTVRARSKQGPAQLDTLVREVTQRTSGLLEDNDRVLVVYGEGRANLYYEGTPAPARRTGSGLKA